MMNRGTKAAISIPKTNIFQLQSALFHSTPVLDRKRRNFWDASHRSNGSSRRSRRSNAKQTLLRNVGAYADHMFQADREKRMHKINLEDKISSKLIWEKLNKMQNYLFCEKHFSDTLVHEWENWQDGFYEEDPSSSSGPSWFRQQYSKGSKKDRTGNQGTRRCGKKGFQFCEDEDYFDVDTLFRSAFGGSRFFYWSFVNEETPRWKNSSGYSYNYGWNWRYRVEEDYDSSSEFDSEYSESNFASDRLALGLSASGPLKLEDVKHACRACALKWHPDRHQGSSKAVAEDKFKLCSAAYQSLCDKLAAA